MKTRKIVFSIMVAIAILFLDNSRAAGIEAQNEPELVNRSLIVYQGSSSCDPEEMGRKIKDSANNLSDTICETSDIVSSDSTGFFSAKDQDFYAKQCERAKGWVNAPGRDSTFSSPGKKDKDACYVVEIPDDDIGDDDGICTQSEKIKGGCNEALDDGIGNDDGVCEQTSESSDGKGKKIKSWETCEEVCIVPEDNQTDCNAMETMDGFLVDANQQLSELNVEVSSQLQELAHQQALYDTISSATDPQDHCANVLYVEITSDVGGDYGEYKGVGRLTSYNTFIQMNIAAEIATGAANICTDIAGQDYGGWNFLAACTLTHIPQSVLTGILSSMELMDDTITGTRLDNAAVCIKQMDAKLNDIDEKLDEIIRLLNTPTGRRDNFPTK